MADENTFEKIHVVRGKIQADQIVRYLHDNNIPSYCRGAGGLFETGRARFTQGYNIFTARKNADAARQLIRDYFQEKVSWKPAHSGNTSRYLLRRYIWLIVVAAVLAAIFIAQALS